jgi:hypothetical protein
MDADISPPHAPTGNEKDHLFSVQVLRPRSTARDSRMTALFGVVVKADPSTLKSVFVLCEILMSRLAAFPARGRHQFNDSLPTSGVKH